MPNRKLYNCHRDWHARTISPIVRVAFIKGFVVIATQLNCINLISPDLKSNTSVFSLHFIKHMPFSKCLDITGCQNIAADSIITSLLRTPNRFRVDGKSLIKRLKSIAGIKVVDASYCGEISVEQAQDIQHSCKRLEFFSFSPSWGSPNLWADLVSYLKHINFGYPVSFFNEEEKLN